MAKALPDRPERADAAFLLLEYAAESGNAEAALAVGRFYDPAYEGSSGSIRKNPTTAFEWYQEALAKGQKQAHNQLAKLRLWVEEKAKQGSSQAKELLNSWH
jgi:TPR repeat protein